MRAFRLSQTRLRNWKSGNPPSSANRRAFSSSRIPDLLRLAKDKSTAFSDFISSFKAVTVEYFALNLFIGRQSWFLAIWDTWIVQRLVRFVKLTEFGVNITVTAQNPNDTNNKRHRVQHVTLFLPFGSKFVGIFKDIVLNIANLCTKINRINLISHPKMWTFQQTQECDRGPLCGDFLKSKCTLQTLKKQRSNP